MRSKASRKGESPGKDDHGSTDPDTSGTDRADDPSAIIMIESAMDEKEARLIGKQLMQIVLLHTRLNSLSGRVSAMSVTNSNPNQRFENMVVVAAYFVWSENNET